MATQEQEAAQRYQWNSTCFAVNEAMAAHVRASITPISKVLSNDHGELEGTGSYVEIHGKPYLITNEHVARVLQTHSIAHQFHGSDNVVRCLHPMLAQSAPVDVAISAIDDRIWHMFAHTATPIPLSRFATRHNPVPGELLFIAGYSGDRSAFWYNTLISRGMPYLTQEIMMSADHGNAEYHFALHYNPERASSPVDRAEGLPTPPGLSGSLVWNTRFVERKQAGVDWTPTDAQVTGIVWGWPSGGSCLIATKVEHLGLMDLVTRAKAAQA